MNEEIKPLIYAVDLDGMLCEGVCYTPEECLNVQPNLETIKKINELNKTNFIVIYTARRDHLLPATMEWLRRNNVMYHAISNIKMPADVYLDDKNRNL